jgi:spore germination cell wall hydrolase CwlJ-like protein
MEILIKKILREELNSSYSTPEEIIAATIASEASGEGEKGMRAVMHVIRNRAFEKYKNTNIDSLKRITLKPKQFSGWNDVDKESVVDITKRVNFYKKKFPTVWSTALNLVKNPGKNPVDDRNHYYNPNKANPSWGSHPNFLETKLKIGNHLFGKI